MSDQLHERFIIYFDGRPLYTKPVTPFKGPKRDSDTGHSERLCTACGSARRNGIPSADRVTSCFPPTSRLGFVPLTQTHISNKETENDGLFLRRKPPRDGRPSHGTGHGFGEKRPASTLRAVKC